MAMAPQNDQRTSAPGISSSVDRFRKARGPETDDVKVENAVVDVSAGAPGHQSLRAAAAARGSALRDRGQSHLAPRCPGTGCGARVEVPREYQSSSGGGHFF